MREYLDSFVTKKNQATWKFPLGIGDRIHLAFLRFVVRFSWFSDMLYIVHPHKVSPPYQALISFLQKNTLIDNFQEKDLAIEGYFYFCCRKNIFINGQSEIIKGEGVADDREEALSKAVGETVERVVSGFFDTNRDVTISSFEDISKHSKCFYPPRFHRLSGVQKDINRNLLSNQNIKKIEWVKGVDLITREDVYFPKAITSWFLGNRKGNKDLVVSATSSGCAGFFSKEGAVLRGLMEVVERDAFLVHWLTKTVPDNIILESLPDGLKQKVKLFNQKGFIVSILNITALPFPTVCIVALNTKAEVPYVTVTASTSLSFKESIEKALEEITKMLGFFMVTTIESNTFFSREGQFEKTEAVFLDKDSRRGYWRGENKIKEIGWFLAGKQVSYNDLSRDKERYFSSDAEKLSHCLKVLKLQGEEYYPSVYYPKNNIQKEIGFYVAQVYIPKAFPFYLVENYATFDSDRLDDFFELKHGNRNTEVNTVPHMFI